MTGFGLLGHGLEMARASGTRFVFDAAALPALDGALDLAAAGVETGGAAHNRRFVLPALTVADGVAPELVTLAHDPQTSGGLLAAIGPATMAAVESDLDGSRRPALAGRPCRGRRPGRRAGVGRTMEIAPGIRRIGASKVNVYLIEESGGITIVDAGLPGYWGDLQAELTAMGRTIEDVRAVLLTHAHDDHIGFAERIRSERGTPIHLHEADAALARGEAKQKNEGGGPMRPLPILSFLVYAIRKGYLRTKRIAEVSTFGDGATLDVPGSPRVIHVPGHTAGSAALLPPVTRRDPRRRCLRDAERDERLDRAAALPELQRRQPPGAGIAGPPRRPRGRTLVLPGHGEPWTGGLAEALRLVRASSPAG